ncbi:rpl14 [Symbiodinium natans]|uniref:Rpl14 protein n=1 Tax=Symbiodinium natans TaxID=878477 RepID=A0A812KL11_9DINO|nr:rpl14 [Symbiodinium natans]
MCQDNSGAYKMKIMGVVGKGSKPHVRAVEPGDVVVVVGRTGGPKNKVLRAIVTRMRRNTPEPLGNGFRHAFDTNCGVLVDQEGNPVGSKIFGKIDPRCALRWPKLAQLSAR